MATQGNHIQVALFIKNPYFNEKATRPEDRRKGVSSAASSNVKENPFPKRLVKKRFEKIRNARARYLLGLTFTRG